MRDEEAAQKPQTTPSSSGGSLSASYSSKHRDGTSFEGLFGRGKYKLWALAAITLLALWSMFTGSLTLKLSAVTLKHSSQTLDTSFHADLDVLDVDEREKLVRQMWNAYKHSRIVRLPSFWRDAFGAAYQHLTSEAASVRDAALLEIARMSFRSQHIYDLSPLESTSRLSEDEIRPSTNVRKIRKRK